jgi:hypothetical protein
MAYRSFVFLVLYLVSDVVRVKLLLYFCRALAGLDFFLKLFFAFSATFSSFAAMPESGLHRIYRVYEEKFIIYLNRTSVGALA